MAFWNRGKSKPSALDDLEGAEERALYLNDVWGSHAPLPDTASGALVSPLRALQMVAVWASISLIADNVSTLPLQLFHPGKSDEPLPDQPWLAQPNYQMTSIDFWHRVMTSLLMDGNAFIAYEMNATRTGFTYLLPIAPSLVQIYQDPESGTLTYWVGGRPFTLENLIHIRAFSLAGVNRGLSPLEYARLAVGLGLTAEEFGARFFDQGITMSGVIEAPKDLTKDQAGILAKTFSAMHSGTKKSHLPGVLTNGAAWKQITITPEQAQFLETRRFQKAEIAALYRVPAYLLDPTVQSSWGTGIQEQNRAFVQYTLRPWLSRIEQAITSVLSPRALKVKFNLDDLLRADIGERYKAYKMGRDAGFLLVSDIRKWENLPPIPEPTTLGPPAADPVDEETGEPLDPSAPVDDKSGAPADATK